MARTVTALVPCRAGSERVPQKNTVPFAGMSDGLIGLKLRQLCSARRVDRIVVSTDDDAVKRVCEAVAHETGRQIEVHDRDPDFASSATSTGALIRHLIPVIPGDAILWTHVTSPLITSTLYDRAIETFTRERAAFDSLMSVTAIQEFLWSQDGAVNFDRRVEAWPRTQDLPRWYIVNSGLFIADKETMLRLGDRIGERVFLFEVSRLEGLDVDWPDDFALAELAWRASRDRI